MASFWNWDYRFRNKHETRIVQKAIPWELFLTSEAATYLGKTVLISNTNSRLISSYAHVAPVYLRTSAFFSFFKQAFLLPAKVRVDRVLLLLHFKIKFRTSKWVNVPRVHGNIIRLQRIFWLSCSHCPLDNKGKFGAHFKTLGRWKEFWFDLFFSN